MKSKGLLVWLILVLALVGCGRQSIDPSDPIYAPISISHDGLRDFLLETDLDAWDGYALADRNYVVYREEWFRANYSSLLNQFYSDLKVKGWVADLRDCDDFSRLSSAFAKLLYANYKCRAKGTSVAFGEVYYKKDGAEFHAVNLIVVADERNELKVLFFEPNPQVLRVINLSSSEQASALNWFF